jgi:hypothetical protein
MQRRGAVLPQGGEMVRSAISLVRCQAVHGKDRVPGGDHAVAFNLREDGGGGDRGRERVAVNDRLLREFGIEPDGIDQKIAGRRRQLLDGMEHGKARSLIDIDLIDAGGIHGGHGPGDAMLANSEREFLAAFGGNQFGITQATNAIGRIEDHGSGDDRAEQRSAANFVDSGNVVGARGPCPLLEIQSAAQFFQQAQLGGGGRQTVCVRRL